MAELPDPYCDAVLVGSIPVATVYETDRVWAFHHPRPSFDPVHIVLIPKEHVDSLVTLRSRDVDLQLEVLHALSVLGEEVVRAHGECQMHVNLGHYLHSGHLHIHVTSDPRIRTFPPDGDDDAHSHRWATEGARGWAEYWRAHSPRA